MCNLDREDQRDGSRPIKSTFQVARLHSRMPPKFFCPCQSVTPQKRRGGSRDALTFRGFVPKGRFLSPLDYPVAAISSQGSAGERPHELCVAMIMYNRERFVGQAITGARWAVLMCRILATIKMTILRSPGQPLSAAVRRVNARLTGRPATFYNSKIFTTSFSWFSDFLR
jgi:hypothetical protein